MVHTKIIDHTEVNTVRHLVWIKMNYINLSIGTLIIVVHLCLCTEYNKWICCIINLQGNVLLKGMDMSLCL